MAEDERNGYYIRRVEGNQRGMFEEERLRERENTWMYLHGERLKKRRNIKYDGEVCVEGRDGSGRGNTAGNQFTKLQSGCNSSCSPHVQIVMAKCSRLYQVL